MNCKCPKCGSEDTKVTTGLAKSGPNIGQPYTRVWCKKCNQSSFVNNKAGDQEVKPLENTVSLKEIDRKIDVIIDMIAASESYKNKNNMC